MKDAEASLKELSEAAAMMTDPDLPLGEQIQNRKLMLVFNKLAEVSIEQAMHNAGDTRQTSLQNCCLSREPIEGSPASLQFYLNRARES